MQCAESGTLPNHPQECVTELPDMSTIFRATFWVLEFESHTAGARQQPPQVQHAQKMRSEMVTAETEQDMIWERVTEEEEDPWRELGMDDACHESVELGENDVWLGRGDVFSFGSLKRWIRRLTCLQLKWHPIRLTYCCRRISWSELEAFSWCGEPRPSSAAVRFAVEVTTFLREANIENRQVYRAMAVGNEMLGESAGVEPNLRARETSSCCQHGMAGR